MTNEPIGNRRFLKSALNFLLLSYSHRDRQRNVYHRPREALSDPAKVLARLPSKYFVRNHCDFVSDLYEEIVKPFYAKMN